MVEGTVITGGVVSTTLTVKEIEPMFPAESTAEQVTTVPPKANTAPEVWSHCTSTGSSTSSTAETTNSTTAPLGPVASIVIAEGPVTTGGVLSGATEASITLAPTIPVSGLT